MNMMLVRKGLILASLLILLQIGCEDSTTPPIPENVTFSTASCLGTRWIGMPPQVIRSQAALDSVLPEGICTDSLIDFSKYTVLYQSADYGGCDVPFIEASITKDSQRREILCKLRVIEHGTCSVAVLVGHWVLIPIIPDGYQVVFQRETIVESSAT